LGILAGLVNGQFVLNSSNEELLKVKGFDGLLKASSAADQ
jgi:hypothetical protein